MNFSAPFENAEAFKKRTFGIVEKDEKLSYEHILNRTARFQAYALERGLKPSDKVVISTTDKAAFAELVLGCYRTGLTFIPVDPATHPDRLKSMMNLVHPAICFLDDLLADKWEVIFPVIRIKKVPVTKGGLFGKVFKKEPAAVSSDTYPALLDTHQPAEGFPQIDPSSAAYIMFTSGTTSNPKGVEISYGALFSHMTTLKRIYQLSENSAIFNNLNLYHADGANQGPILAFIAGCSWVSSVPLEVTQLPLVFNAIYKHRITHYITVPTLLAFFEKYIEGYEDSFQTEDFKYIISVAAQLDANLWKKTQETLGVKIANLYGLTETVNGSLYAIPGTASHVIGTIGQPVDCEARLVDGRGDDANMGELWLKGPHLMTGYYGNMEESSAVLTDGWLRTGDLAQRGESGCYRIVGRIKRMINSGGFRIHPEEIEEVLASVAGVREAIVMGVDDPLMVEKIIAFLVPETEASISVNDLFKILRDRLEHEKVPAEIVITDQFPRNAGGKVDLTKLRVSWGNQKQDHSQHQDLDTQVMSMAAKVFKVDDREISPSSTPGALAGWDSLNHFVLITNLEDEFSLSFSTQDIMAMTSIGAIISLVKRKKK